MGKVESVKTPVSGSDTGTGFVRLEQKKIAECYQPLFDHLHDEHGLTLLASEMDEIIGLVEIVNKNLSEAWREEDDFLHLQFQCPKCGGNFFGTDGTRGINGTGLCHEFGCGFTWDRATQDKDVFFKRSS